MRRPTGTKPTPVITSTDVARWTPLVRIRGRSMQPTLAAGQVLLTRPARGRLAIGDVVVVDDAVPARGSSSALPPRRGMW